MAIFKRCWRLKIEVESVVKVFSEIENTDTSAKIDFDATSKTSKWGEGNITIYNLNTADLAYLASSVRVSGGGKMRLNKVSLEAGYGGNLAVILCGNIQSVDVDFTSADRKATLKVQGAFAENMLKNSVAVSLDGDIDLREICKEVSAIQKVKLVYDDKIQPVLQKGYSFLGTPMRLLDDLRQSFKDYYFILSEDGNSLKVKPKENATIIKTDIISEETGMIGSPKPTQYGLTITSILNTNLKCGDFVSVQSVKVPQFNGTYFIYELKHKGSNMNNEWTSTIDLRKRA